MANKAKSSAAVRMLCRGMGGFSRTQTSSLQLTLLLLARRTEIVDSIYRRRYPRVADNSVGCCETRKRPVDMGFDQNIDLHVRLGDSWPLDRSAVHGCRTQLFARKRHGGLQRARMLRFFGANAPKYMHSSWSDGWELRSGRPPPRSPDHLTNELSRPARCSINRLLPPQASLLPFIPFRLAALALDRQPSRRCRSGIVESLPEDFQFKSSRGERAATLLMGHEGSLGRTSLRYLRRASRNVGIVLAGLTRRVSAKLGHRFWTLF